MAVTNAISNVSNGMITVMILLYLNRQVGFAPGVLGMIFAVGGLTSLAGSATARKWSWFGGFGPALVLAGVIRSFGLILVPLAASVSAVAVVLLVLSQFITDPAWSFYEINVVSLRQSITPAGLLGRMNASMRCLDLGAMLAGSFAAGILGESIGFRETLFAAVGVRLISVLWLALSPIARLRVMPEGIEMPAAEAVIPLADA